jgi:hypothetical protein
MRLEFLNIFYETDQVISSAKKWEDIEKNSRTILVLQLWQFINVANIVFILTIMVLILKMLQKIVPVRLAEPVM